MTLSIASTLTLGVLQLQFWLINKQVDSDADVEDAISGADSADNKWSKAGEMAIKYPFTWVAMLISALSLVPVFLLLANHTVLISENLTTKEKVRHIYDYLPRSPFAHASVRTNWKKLVCCPNKRTKSRLTKHLFLKTNNPESSLLQDD